MACTVVQRPTDSGRIAPATSTRRYRAAMPDPTTVNVRRDGAAATIELARPETLNAWDARLGTELLAALRAAADDDGVRAVVLTGAGRAFSTGADLRDVTGGARTAAGDPDIESMLVERYHPIVELVRAMPKPVLAAVNGPAVGIGCSLALAADLVVARESAYFLLAFVNIGLVPDGGSSLFVPSRVGFARAAEMALLGERVPAPRALEWGLVNRVVPDDRFDDEVAGLRDRLAAGPTRAYAGAKRQLNAWLYEGVQRQLALEARIQQELAGSADFAEGVAAFLQKRPATFGGA
jgi:2-(1,2-epoxy-1,2-dihydrophenyl)acetyl-CoA isomerase